MNANIDVEKKKVSVFNFAKKNDIEFPVNNFSPFVFFSSDTLQRTNKIYHTMLCKPFRNPLKHHLTLYVLFSK